MKIPCKHCSCTGFIIGPPIYQNSTTLGFETKISTSHCKYCNGEGWIDEDEPITVPRKHVKDDYFNSI